MIKWTTVEPSSGGSHTVEWEHLLAERPWCDIQGFSGEKAWCSECDTYHSPDQTRLVCDHELEEAQLEAFEWMAAECSEYFALRFDHVLALSLTEVRVLHNTMLAQVAG